MTSRTDPGRARRNTAVGATRTCPTGWAMGPIGNRQVEELRDALQRHGVTYLFIGKTGAILHGFPDTTQDADLYVQRTLRNGIRYTSGRPWIRRVVGKRADRIGAGAPHWGRCAAAEGPIQGSGARPNVAARGNVSADWRKDLSGCSSRGTAGSVGRWSRLVVRAYMRNRDPLPSAEDWAARLDLARRDGDRWCGPRPVCAGTDEAPHGCR